jgi:hypothetical protein
MRERRRNERCDTLWLPAESPGVNREPNRMLELREPVYTNLAMIAAAISS